MRRILRQHEVVADEWRSFGEDASDADADVARRQVAEPLAEKGWAAVAASGSLNDTTALARSRLGGGR